MPRCWWVLASLTCVLLLPAVSTRAQDDDDDDSRPGLIAELSVGSKTIRRIDPDLSFAWGAEAPDVRLPAGPFRAHWAGQILVRSEGELQFHAWLQGKLTLRVRDEVVLQAESATPQWVSGPKLPFRFGEWPVVVDYERTGGQGTLQVAWSSNDFPLEPLPTHALYHTAPDAVQKAVARGRDQFDGFRCQACHDGGADVPVLSAPKLDGLRNGTNPAWLVEHLTRKEMPAQGSRMPAFGLSKVEAQDVLAALAAQSRNVELPKASEKKADDKQRAAGKALILSTGCLACHTWNKVGRDSPWGGPALDEIAHRRTRAWLLTWLQDPAKLNATHRMPVFTLSDAERLQIAAALIPEPQRTSAWKDIVADGKDAVQRGRELLASRRCAGCHQIENITATAAPSLRRQDVNWDAACSSAGPAKPRQPKFAGVDQADVRAYVDSSAMESSPTGPFLRGERLLTTKGCLLCHDRNGQKGLSAIAADIARTEESLDGHAQLLVPPSLTALGDRMQDAALVQSVKGEQKRRMDWLKVRMPKFQHSAADLAALSTYLIGHDRIPTPTPASPKYPVAETGKRNAEQLLAGRELLGGKGFSCIACHRLKDYEPKNVARGTRGSNLFEIGQRMRPEFFFRWTRSPLRVTPGVEMPSYQRPHATLLAGDIEAQLAAIWEACNDPGLSIPSNPAVLEQFWTVAKGESPRIVRDVMTINNGAQKTSIPRAFAAGFDNGHAILLDLDRLALRGWTVGDFARQRTEGKSWFWDLAGASVAEGWTGDSDFVLLRETTGEVLGPANGEPASIRLLDYRVDRGSKSVELRYRMKLTADAGEMTIAESWRALPFLASDGGGGWARRIALEDAPARLRLAFREPAATAALGAISIHAAAPARWEVLKGTELSGALIAAGTPLEVHYRSTLAAQSAPYTPLPELIPEPQPVTDVPGYRGIRLPLPRSIMPTAFTWTSQGQLAFTSLKGHVYLAEDTNGDGLEDKLILVEEGLAAPYGIIADGPDLIVAHKPELLRLRDTDGDGRADLREVVATGWGYTDNYHDWTCGIVRDDQGDLLVALGSDYTQKGRPAARAQFRGNVLRISPSGQMTPVATGLRYATGLALTLDGELLATDQQGEQNVFNELNAIRLGRRYGVPALHDPDKSAPSEPPAVWIPHDWTRSVNGIATIPATAPRYAGDILGCEYNNRLLIRLTTQLVDGERQGAVFPFSRPGPETSSDTLSGPLSIAFGPQGEFCVGEIRDSGWLGGLNVGSIVRFVPADDLPNGLKDILTTPDGLELVFHQPVDRKLAADPAAYQVAGYTRLWGGSYATPDSGRHTAAVQSATVNATGDRVRLVLPDLKIGHLYDVSVGEIGGESQRTLWPPLGHVTIHRKPTR